MTRDEIAKGLCKARLRMWDMLELCEQSELRREADWVMERFEERPDPVETLKNWLFEELMEGAKPDAYGNVEGAAAAILGRFEWIAELAQRRPSLVRAGSRGENSNRGV